MILMTETIVFCGLCAHVLHDKVAVFTHVMLLLVHFFDNPRAIMNLSASRYESLMSRYELWTRDDGCGTCQPAYMSCLLDT